MPFHIRTYAQDWHSPFFFFKNLPWDFRLKKKVLTNLMVLDAGGKTRHRSHMQKPQFCNWSSLRSVGLFLSPG